MRAVPLAILAAILAVMVAPIGWAQVTSAQGYSCDQVIYEVLPDGSVFVNTTITVSNPPVVVVIRAEAPLLMAWAVDDTGAILPVDFNDTAITVTVYNASKINVTYYTQALTSKEGPYWKLTLNPACKAYIILPDDAVPILVEPPNPEAALINGRLALVFPPGQVNITYMLIPGIPATQTPATTTTSQVVGGYTTVTETTDTITGTTNTNTPDVTTTSGGEGGIILPAVAAIVALAAIAAVAYRARSRSPASPGTEAVPVARPELDERDKMILEALRGGPKTASELMQETGIPKTPLYRRLRRLTDEGLIEAFDEGGVRKYRLRGE